MGRGELWDLVSNANIKLLRHADASLARASTDRLQQESNKAAAGQSFRDLYVAQMADYFGTELVGLRIFLAGAS